jgi:hypothetical protein
MPSPWSPALTFIGTIELMLSPLSCTCIELVLSPRSPGPHLHRIDDLTPEAVELICIELVL